MRNVSSPKIIKLRISKHFTEVFEIEPIITYRFMIERNQMRNMVRLESQGCEVTGSKVPHGENNLNILTFSG